MRGSSSNGAPSTSLSVATSGTTESTSADSVAPTSPSQPERPARDSSWLELEVCRDFQRQSCPRNAETCRFAHPQDNPSRPKVTCCYDFLKDRCRRERCKYFHPPQHIKERLVTAGKQFGAMMSTTYVMPTSAYPMPAVSGIEAAGLPPVSVMGMNGNVVPSAPPPPPPVFYPAPMLSPYGMVTDKLHICPEFMMDQCNVLLCPFVHPEPHTRCNIDSTVTVCRDFVRGGCLRSLCRYYHPPPHILSQMESASMSGVVNMSPQGLLMAPAVPPDYSPRIMIPCPPRTPVPVGPYSLPSYPVMPFPVQPSSVPVIPMMSGPVAVPFPAGVPLSSPSPVPAAVVPVQSISGTCVAPLVVEPPSSPGPVSDNQQSLVVPTEIGME